DGPAAARQDGPGFRAARADRSRYGAAAVVEPDHRDLVEAQGLERDPEPFPRPGSDRRLDGKLSRRDSGTGFTQTGSQARRRLQFDKAGSIPQQDRFDTGEMNM